MSRHTLVISGATKGLGREVSLAFARAGHRVVGFYASDEAKADELRRDLQKLGAEATILRHDVATDDPLVWDRPELRQSESFVLVNNASAPFTPKPFHLWQWADFERHLDVGLKGSWLGARALLRPMVKAGRGTIVNILTTATHGLPPNGFAAYATAKHAVRGLTLSLAAEYGARGLRVFSVSPGFMPTAMSAGWDARLVAAMEAAGGRVEPADVARRIFDLVENPATPGRGEDYPVE